MKMEVKLNTIPERPEDLLPLGACLQQPGPRGVCLVSLRTSISWAWSLQPALVPGPAARSRWALGSGLAVVTRTHL